MDTSSPSQSRGHNAAISQRRLATADARTTLISPYCRLETVLLISGVFLGIVLLLHTIEEIPIADLTRDPVAIADMRAYIGFLSQAGIFFWSGTAMVCLFCATALPCHAITDNLRRFLLVSGLFTLCLGLDDAFLIHEEILPHFGIRQRLVLSTYACFTLVYLIIFRRLIFFETRFQLMVLALLFFATSLVLDIFEPFDYYLVLFEDGFKLIGIVTWTTYFVSVADHSVNSASPRLDKIPISD